jgi:hypothetical protein
VQPFSVVGQQVTFTATVSSQTTGTPGGAVSFVIDGNSQGSVGLNGANQASVSFTFSSAGPHSLVATYSGDAVFAPSTGTFSQQVNAASTSTSVGSSVTPYSYFGQPVTFTATVSAVSPGSGTPTSGTVTFNIDNGAITQIANLSGSNQASFTVSSLNSGYHSIVATYGGTTNFAASGPSATFTQPVAPANTNLAITSTASPAVLGQSVVIIATITAIAPGIGLPTGSVSFVVDNVPQAPVAMNGNGQAGISLSGLSVGAHSISARYNNFNNNFSPSTNSFTQVVNPIGTSMSIASTPTNAVYGQAVTLIATVAAVAPGTGVPNGSVTFTVDGVAQAPVAVNVNGQAGIVLSNPTGGNHTITARFNNGTTTYAPTTASINLPVAPGTTTMSISSSANPAFVGQGVVFIATIASASGTPTGSVTFSVDGVAQAPVAVNANGQAGIILSTLSIGTHSVTARFNNGNTNFAPTTAGISQTVLDVATRLSAALTIGVHAQSPFGINVSALDAQGILVTTWTGSVSLALLSAPAGGALAGGNSPVSFSNGQALFNNLQVNVAGSYTVRFTSSDGLTVDYTFSSGGRMT